MPVPMMVRTVLEACLHSVEARRANGIGELDVGGWNAGLATCGPTAFFT